MSTLGGQYGANRWSMTHSVSLEMGRQPDAEHPAMPFMAHSACRGPDLTPRACKSAHAAGGGAPAPLQQACAAAQPRRPAGSCLPPRLGACRAQPAAPLLPPACRPPEHPLRQACCRRAPPRRPQATLPTPGARAQPPPPASSVARRGRPGLFQQSPSRAWECGCV